LEIILHYTPTPLFVEEIAKQATFSDVVGMVIYLGLPIFITTA
jgi:hypothetical protein